jgi:hypothetical protein|tara:strand:+ start:457 stop:1047 length:591 start_codon:yes stop_codon:yes gene_type:complete
VTSRKKKILSIQVLIFVTTIFLIYFTYYRDNQSVSTLGSKPTVIEEETDEVSKSNSFEKVEYKGLDLEGNRYIIKSKKASFEIDTPELINMKIMTAIFYLKDGSLLEVQGDYGTYNNVTNDMAFRDNIIAKYNSDYLYSDNLDYLNSKKSLSIYGNVRTESIQGNIVADNLEFDLSKKTLDISMFGKNKVNVKIKN